MDFKGGYEALSYVWGSPRGNVPIECEGKTLLITPNCEAALRRIRRRTRTRALWIDAICIDQASTDEKNAQVQLMSEVYSKARRVIVWLGDDEDGGALSTRLLAITQTVFELLLPHSTYGHYPIWDRIDDYIKS
jgi:hypothetical protein